MLLSIQYAFSQMHRTYTCLSVLCVSVCVCVFGGVN